MKKLIIVLFFINIHYLYSQLPCYNYCLSFEDTLCLSHLNIDSVSFPENLWQIGKLQKTSFDHEPAFINVIVTDTVNPYPVNNHSVFTIRNTATMGDIYGCRMLHMQYNIQTDSIRDYGLIEFSPDNGRNWIDILNDTLYSASFVWYSQKPVLTGNTYGWKYFDVIMVDNGSVFNINLGDTLLFRFSFISDSIPDSLGGMMYDNICFDDFVEGISEIHFKPIKSTIYPNPSTNIFTIEFENPDAGQFGLSVYDIHSRLILKNDNIRDNKIEVDARLFKQGTYIYKITNLEKRKRCWGKFIINR